MHVVYTLLCPICGGKALSGCAMPRHGNVVVECIVAQQPHDLHGASCMWSGDSQRCHARSPPGPSRRITTFSSVALKRRQMHYLWVRRSRTCRCPGVSEPSHFRPSIVALPTIPLFSIQEQTLASQPQNILHHSLAYDTRLFHAEKGILRETLVDPASGDASNFGCTRGRQASHSSNHPLAPPAGVECGLRTWPQAIQMPIMRRETLEKNGGQRARLKGRESFCITTWKSI